MFPLLASILPLFSTVHCLCGASIRWSHNFNMDDVYGMWYGVGYARHTPDMTDKPTEVGCVTQYITDVSTEVSGDWLDWTVPRTNYSDQNWHSYKNNPWSDTPLSGSWLDIRVRRRAKRDMYDERRVRVLWDEDGQTMEQTYVYSPDEPGLWTIEQWRPMEKEMKSRGIDVWYPDDPPRHPEVIRVLKATPDTFIFNHCSELGDGGVFSLVLRRSPAKVNRWEWYEIQRQFFSFELPTVYRHAAICASCVQTGSATILFLCVILANFIRLFL